MSLFKCRDWWATVVGSDEEFDQGCLCIGNVDNNVSGLDKICVGSFHGYLRIYNPRPIKTDDGWTGFVPEDVMCETHLGQPIVQVECGKFVSGSENIHIAVLHPRKISVYNVAGSSGAVEHGTQYQLKLVYEHNLKRTGFNFCFGPFGGVKGRDFICVQSMDGTVSVFEQETFAFSRFLPGALLPGPIKYVPRTDSFVTVSSSRQVESYKYQVLAVATDAKTKEESQSLKSGKKVAFDWTFNIGEQAVDMMVVGFPNAPPAIMVLGERNLFCLSETGKLRYMKKFNFCPSCFYPYAAVSEGAINCLLATHTKTMLVYQDITMKWAAQLDSIPVQVRVGAFQDLRGVIVTLDETGHLTCAYLGTDPALFTPPPSSQVREIDYAAQDQEMAQLQRIIKDKQHNTAPAPVAIKDEEIQLSIQLPTDLDTHSQAEEVNIQDPDPIPSLTAKIVIKARVAVSDVKVSITPTSPIIAHESNLIIPSIDPARPAESRVVFYMKHAFLPSDMMVTASATYQNTSGAPRVVQATVRLPLQLVVKPCMPVKTANFKLTIDTNKSPVNLNDIFPDIKYTTTSTGVGYGSGFELTKDTPYLALTGELWNVFYLLGENAGGPGNALGFQVYGGAVITVLASKTSQRYRLQCDEFEAMWPIANELTARLTSYFLQRKEASFRVSYDGALPLQEYFDVLDRHFECRQNAERYKVLLADRASQFRAIQRRLLTRFKDKTPAPLANLDTLLDGTYRQLLALADAAEDNRYQQAKAAAALSCGTRLLNLLIKLWKDMNANEFKALESALTPCVTDNGEQGWEEVVDAAITHLLRTCLAKNAKDQTVNPAPLGILKDTTKLKKHIALLCDRLSKGASLNVEGMAKATNDTSSAPRPSQTSKSGMIPEEPSESSAPGELGEAQVPMGSRFGESKSPRGKGLAPISKGKGAGTLPALGGTGATNLPSLGPSQPQDIPDLGALESGEGMVNGDKEEMVYGL